MGHIVKTLKEAFAEVASLPESDQEAIGRSLLSHVEKLHRLRAELDKGVRSLDAGRGEEPDFESFLRDMNDVGDKVDVVAR
jgi:hypothetical protein